MDWIEQTLSSEQRQVFEWTDSHLCILATAGSGKTRTLTHLVAKDLSSGIPAPSIVAFTFTEKAADELLARIHSMAKQYLCDVDLTGIFVGTIHSWCFHYLSQLADYRNAMPIDELHVDALASRLYDYLGLSGVYGLTFPKAIGPFVADLEVYYNEQLHLNDVPHSIRPCIHRFCAILAENRLLTFGQMVRAAVDALRSNGPVQGLLRLYVDEYQDVNPAQVSLIKAMLPPNGRLVVVGDDLQCIYNWRGSDVKRIIDFTKDFPGARIRRLSTNYRSRPDIVKLANAIAQHTSIKDTDRGMIPERPEPCVPSVVRTPTRSDADETRCVADLIEGLYRNGVPYGAISVLLRSVLGSGRPFIDEFERRGIPYYCPSLGRGDAFIRQLILPIFQWLSTDHPEPRNRQEECEQEAEADAIFESANVWLGPAASEDTFWDAMVAWRDKIEEGASDAYNVRGMFYEFLDKCDIRIGPEDPDLTVGLSISSQIMRSCEEIHRRRIHGQPRRTPRGVMREVYYAILRYRDQFGESIPLTDVQDAVTVSTIHQAKGLEWPVVIIPCLRDGRFPVRPSRQNTSFDDSIAGRYGTSLDDERRLFYVAVTRGRERVYLLDHVRSNGSSKCQFVRELIDDDCLHAGTEEDVARSIHIDLEDLKRSPDGPVRIGITDLLLYLECPFQFALRRVAGVEPAVGEELGFGKGLHELIQRRLESGHDWDQQCIDDQTSAHVNLPYMSSTSEESARRTIAERLAQLQRLGILEGRVVSEIPVEFLIGPGVVHGVIDCIVETHDGRRVIRDWKTNVHPELLPRYQRQLQFYSLALSHMESSVALAEIVDVAESHRRGCLVAEQVDISDGAIGDLVDRIAYALSGIAGRSFTPTPSSASCLVCDVAVICKRRCRDA